jgi:long-subunit acyl-CoA synthetase (AMP-forming)
MLSYTSGTTGDPKAVKLTHRMMITNWAAAEPHGFKTTMEDRLLSYLPLAHVMEQVFMNYALSSGY